MRITQQYERDGLRIEVEPRPRPLLRLAMVAVAVVAGALGFLAIHFDRRPWQPFAIAGIALALGMGRSVYSIRPGKDVRFRQLLLGVPVLGQTVPPESIQSAEVEEQPDGTFTLRFRDAGGGPSLTLERFRSRETAGRIADLFRFDARRLDAGIDAVIATALRENREFSPLFQALAVGLVFPVMPLMLWLMPPESGNPFLHVASGVMVTGFVLLATRREGGVLRHSREEASIDRWVRHGPFRRVEWRQFLGSPPTEQFLRVRPDPWIWIVLAVCAAQAALILALHRMTEARDDPPRPGVESAAAPDPEAVRRGAEILEEVMRRRRQAGDPPTPDPAGENP